MTGDSEYGVPAALEFVDRLRDEIVPAAGFPDGVDVFAGGGPPGGKTSLTSRTAPSRGSCSPCSS